jgi:predicted SAM-dependent methyltransferase
MVKDVKINLGSGPDGIEGWINYDWGWLPLLGKLTSLRKFLIWTGILSKNYERIWPGVELQDLRKGIPLQNESVDWVYSSNFLEHLEKYETARLLSECFRVLKKGGRVRLVVPDINKVIGNYQQNGDADLFCREFYGFDKDKLTGLSRKAIRGHQWMYDFKSLTSLLKECGFKNILKSKYRESGLKDVVKLDLAVHQELGLYVEASKI